MRSLLYNDYSPASVEKLAALKAGGLTYTVHLPLWSVEPSTPLTPVRQGSVEAVVQIIRATLPIEPEVYVLHATGALAAEFYNMRDFRDGPQPHPASIPKRSPREYPHHALRDRPPQPAPSD